MLQDVRFALRLFARQRGFFVTAVLTIAVGVGLSATVFAVVDGVLFRPLPYRESDRLVALYGAVRAEGQFTMPASVPDVVDWRAASRTMQQIEAYDLGRPQAVVRGVEASAQVRCSGVTAGFFELLAVRVAMGRTFAPADYRPDAVPAAVISYRMWRGIFGSDPAILGRTIGVGATQHVIVGVLPRWFVFPTPGRRFAPEVLVPFATAGLEGDRAARFLYVIGRLAPGVSRAEAQAELDAVALRLKPLFVARPKARPGAFDGVSVIDLRAHLTRSTRSALWLVFGAVAGVFVIACVNLAALLLARSEDRRRELAVRAAIGAGRATLLRQLLIEATLLATVGTATGWFLTVAWFGALLRRIPQWTQLLGEPALDGRAAAFAAVLAVLTVSVAGVMPAVRASSEAPRASLAAGTRQLNGSRRARHMLITVEVALATILLCAGSIMLRSWLKLYAQDTGMDADRVIALRAIPAGLADAPRRNAFNHALAEAIRRVPGVETADFVDMPLLQRAVKGSSFTPPQRVPHAAGMDTDVQVTPGYFDTMGIRQLVGRGLRAEDRGRAVVISEALANRYWPGRNPVGEFIRYGEGTREIVGVVTSARDVSLDGAPMPTLYHVWDDAHAPVATLVARVSRPAERLLPEIRRAVRGVDELAAVTMLASVEDLLSTSVAERNFNTLLFAVFAGAGLIVAIVGIYGLVAFVVARREREMGIRLALGATGRGLKFFVVSATLRWIGAGLAVGIVGAVLCAQYLKPLVFQVQPADPATLAAAGVGFLLVASLASYIPARRAASVDPMIALRAE